MHCINCPGRTATAPTRAGRGRGEVGPPGKGAPVNSASFLEGAWLSVPTSRNNFPSPSPLLGLTAPFPNPGTAGPPRCETHRPPPSPNQPHGMGSHRHLYCIPSTLPSSSETADNSSPESTRTGGWSGGHLASRGRQRGCPEQPGGSSGIA